MKTQKTVSLFLLALVLWMSGCGKKSNESYQTMIAGTTSKTWKATKETNASGDKDKLSDEEKKEVMQFYADGKFTVNSSTQNANGTWTSDQAAKTLTLQFAGANVTETFQVEDISDDKMKLKGREGSLTMETE